MGSLPNLHELEEAERKREKRREYELLREQRARDIGGERERARLSLFEKRRKQFSYNAYLMAGISKGSATATAAALGMGTGRGSIGGGDVGGIGNTGGVGDGTAVANTVPAISTTTRGLSGFAIGGSVLLGFSGFTKKYQRPHVHQHLHQHHHTHHIHQHLHQIQFPIPQTSAPHAPHAHHQHHRHSLTNRHRVLRTRSSGATHNIWDEQLMEHLAAYSPISTRSHRINPVSSYQVQAALAASRRRESMGSSIGATSIRRLITLNNRCRHKVPAHVRQKVCKNFICLAIANGLICAILLPLLALQGSNSVWHHREQWLQIGPNIGSILLSLCFLISAGMCQLTKRLIRKQGYTMLVTVNYAVIVLFLLCHLYPSIYTLLPAYILLGITMSPAIVAKTALLVHFGSKLSCSQHECTLTTTHAMDSLQDEHKVFCNRDQKVRRLTRWYHAAQDIGIIVGALIASFVLACTANDWNCFEGTGGYGDASAPRMSANNTAAPPIVLKNNFNLYSQLWSYIPGYVEDYYNHNEHGVRICGADMCPLWRHIYDVREVRYVRTTTLDATTLPRMELNDTTGNLTATTSTPPTTTTTTTTTATTAPITKPMSIYTHFISSQSRSGGVTLISINILLSVISLALTLLMGKIQATFRHERIKDITDTILFAGPMAYFIGTEQAYMLGDFLRAFVSCSLGISMVAGALVGMGIMQAIVSCTLSMLLRHTKRLLVILAGFFFHSCLLLTLSTWKPSSDDSALFYVIAASWGACNGMWETLLTALVTLNHTNHVIEVTSWMQTLRFLGLGITFAAHGFLCETSKIIALVVVLVISVPPYALLEMRLESQRKATLISL